MPRNRGNTHLKRRRRAADPMGDYDRLPHPLRDWLASAILPWGPRSARKAFDKAIARTGNAAAALRELDRIEARLIAKDTAKIWGHDHPFVQDHAA